MASHFVVEPCLPLWCDEDVGAAEALEPVLAIPTSSTATLSPIPTLNRRRPLGLVVVELRTFMVVMVIPPYTGAPVAPAN